MAHVRRYVKELAILIAVTGTVSYVVIYIFLEFYLFGV